MKVSELMRALADMVASVEQQPPAAPVNTSVIELTPVAVDNEDNTEAEVFVPPLQSKIELLKKSVDVPSVYDDKPHETDELDRVRKIAGLMKPAQLDAAADDEPLDV